MPPLLPDGFDIDDPARFKAGMTKSEWLDHQADLEAARIRRAALADQREAAIRQRVERTVQRWWKVNEYVVERVQERLRAMVPLAVERYMEILDDIEAHPETWTAEDIALVFDVGSRLCGYQPSPELVATLEAMQAAEARG